MQLDQALLLHCKLGAAAVQIGTAYLSRPEATITAVHRKALKSDATRHTALTNLFTGRPARGIVSVDEELGHQSAPVIFIGHAGDRSIARKGGGARVGESLRPWSGQNATGCKEIPAAQLTRELAGV